MMMATRGARASWLALASLIGWVFSAGGAAHADDSGSIQFSASFYEVPSGIGMAFVTVNRVGGSSGPVTVTYSTADANAVAGNDYVATSGALTWTDGDATPRMIPVQIYDGGSGRFALSLLTASGASFGDTPTTHVRIDPLPLLPADWGGALSLSQPVYSISTSATGFTATVDRLGGAAGQVLAGYLITGQGLQTIGSLSWDDGDIAAKSFFVPVPTSSAGTSFNISLISASGASLGDSIDGQVVVRDTRAGSVQLSWTAPSQYTDGSDLSDLAGYYVYADTPGVPGRLIQVSDPTATSVTVKGLQAGVWYFALMAYTAEGLQSDVTNPIAMIIQ